MVDPWRADELTGWVETKRLGHTPVCLWSFQTEADRPPSTPIRHLVALELDSGRPDRRTPRLLPYLNMRLSLETSKYYHRQYCISPYNILLHSIEPRWFIKVNSSGSSVLCPPSITQMPELRRWGGIWASRAGSRRLLNKDLKQRRSSLCVASKGVLFSSPHQE